MNNETQIGFPFLTNIHTAILDAIADRQSDRLFFKNKTPFINMVAGNKLNDSPKRKILYLNYKRDDTGIYQFYDRQFRHIAGIKEISIDYKNKFGSVKRVNINWLCTNSTELEELTPYFLTNGKTIYLEWGWDSTASIIKPDGSTDDSEIRLGQVEISSYIKNRSSGGMFDCVAGIITNFEVTLNKDGSYDCLTEITTPGFLMEAISISNVSSRFTSAQLAMANFKTYLQSGMFYDDILSSTLNMTDINNPDWFILANQSNLFNLKNTFINSSKEKNYNLDFQRDELFLKNTSYISWGFIEDVILRKNYNIIGADKYTFTTLDSREQITRNLPYLRSDDLYVCMIPQYNGGVVNLNDLNITLTEDEKKKNAESDAEALESYNRAKQGEKTYETQMNEYKENEKKYWDEYLKWYNMNIRSSNFRASLEMDVYKPFKTYVHKIFEVGPDVGYMLDYRLLNFIFNLNNETSSIPQFTLRLYKSAKPIIFGETVAHGTLSTYSTKINNMNEFKNCFDAIRWHVEKLSPFPFYLTLVCEIDVIQQNTTSMPINEKLFAPNYTGFIVENYLETSRIILRGYRNLAATINNMIVANNEIYKLPKFNLYIIDNKKSVDKFILKKIDRTIRNPSEKTDIYCVLNSSTDNGIVANMREDSSTILNDTKLLMKSSNGNILYIDMIPKFTSDTILTWNIPDLSLEWKQVFRIHNLALSGLSIGYTTKVEFEDIYNIRFFDSELENMFKEFSDESLPTKPTKPSDDTKGGDAQPSYEFKDKFINDANINPIPVGLKTYCDGYRGEIRKILVNSEFFRKTILENDNIYSGIAAVLNGISNACGSYFGFILSNNPHRKIRGNPTENLLETSWFVFDVNSELPDSAPNEYDMISLTGDNKAPSIFTSYGVKNKLSNATAFSAYYANHASDIYAYGSGDGNLFYNLYKRSDPSEEFVDEFGYQNDLETNLENVTDIKDKNPFVILDESMKSDEQKILRKHYKLDSSLNYLYTFLPLYGAKYNFLFSVVPNSTDKLNGNIQFYLRGTEGMKIGLYNSLNLGTNDHKIIGLIPIEIELGLLGMSGFRIGDCFKLSETPKVFQDNGVFQIINISDSVSKEQWSTKLTAGFRVMSDSNTTCSITVRNAEKIDYIPKKKAQSVTSGGQKAASDSDNVLGSKQFVFNNQNTKSVALTPKQAVYATNKTIGNILTEASGLSLSNLTIPLTCMSMQSEQGTIIQNNGSVIIKSTYEYMLVGMTAKTDVFGYTGNYNTSRLPSSYITVQGIKYVSWKNWSDAIYASLIGLNDAINDSIINTFNENGNVKLQIYANKMTVNGKTIDSKSSLLSDDILKKSVAAEILQKNSNILFEHVMLAVFYLARWGGQWPSAILFPTEKRALLQANADPGFMIDYEKLKNTNNTGYAVLEVRAQMLNSYWNMKNNLK